MSVEFCPNCESLLRKSRGTDGKVYFSCTCGYKKALEGVDGQTGSVPNYVKKSMAKKTLILENVHQTEHPTADVICPKCGHIKAEYFQLQTRSADEPATTFFQCMKCGERWREY
jgi:transcription factor S